MCDGYDEGSIGVLPAETARRARGRVRIAADSGLTDNTEPWTSC